MAATELEELLGFLSSPSPNLKQAALEIVRGLTGSDEGIASLAASPRALALQPLTSLLRDPTPDLASSAADSLVNLSQNPSIAEGLVSLGTIPIAMDLVYKNGVDPGLASRLVMLLANLTQIDSGATALLQIGDDKMEGLYVSKLVRSFCRSSSSEAKEDIFEHVSLVLVNISKLEAGRRILMDPKRGLLKQIVRQFDSSSLLRKKGVAGTIRNCCFEADNQLQNLLLISEFLWPALLLPVAGNKVYSQEDISKMPLEIGNALSHDREPVDDPEIRVQALEAIYLITLQEAGRRALWSVNGPRILQVGYEDEEDPKVMEAYESIGSLLVGNPDTDESATQNVKNN
ncbi:Protein HGH1 C-terminal protein [Dioscorea alata]|uniref:Protein HGH1 C-terminal protein n=1 Tax=Dioscorea alata TaxID=55571 RepID=A0ACB7W829_DIOAL|nr:Protein HGH1 C-terminal protein [Dioscorea alata]